MESISNQLMKVIELQGRINGLSVKLGKLDADSLEANKPIEATIVAKKVQLGNRDVADERLANAENDVLNAVDNLESAQKALADAEDALGKTKIFREKFTDEFFQELDNSIDKAKAHKATIDQEKADIAKELIQTQKDLEKRQAKLQDQGYIINITEPKRSKTTYL